jgi:hypothetical protein
MAKFADVKVWQVAEDDKQAEAVKTARLRALRLDREATDRDSASREIAAKLLLKSQGRQPSRPASRPS